MSSLALMVRALIVGAVELTIGIALRSAVGHFSWQKTCMVLIRLLPKAVALVTESLPYLFVSLAGQQSDANGLWAGSSAVPKPAHYAVVSFVALVWTSMTYMVGPLNPRILC